MDLESKRALLRIETVASHHAIPTHTIVATIVTLPDCFSVSLRFLLCGPSDNMSVIDGIPDLDIPSDSEMARNPNALFTMKALLFVR